MRIKLQPGKKPTISDIAREVGVSTTTVINVLKGKASEVSPKTSEKILKVVKRVGYVKNLTASALSSSRSNVIAVVMGGAFHSDPRQRNLEINPFYGDFILRLEHAARSRGYSLSLYAGGEEHALPFLLQRSHDAVLVLGVSAPTLPRSIAGHRLPQILFDSFLERGDYTRVCSDESVGGRLGVEHLLKRGCRKLVFVGDVRLDIPTLIPTLRYRAAEEFCRKAGVALDMIPVSTSFEDGARVASGIVAGGYDGVVTAADIIAAGLVQGLRHAGVAVPDRVAVVGYDNLLVARLCIPTLTTVDQRLDDKISAALDLVETPRDNASVVIPPRLVVRESA